MTRIADEHIIRAEAMRLKAVPNEAFPLRIHAVAKFLNLHPDIVTGVVVDYQCGLGAG